MVGRIQNHLCQFAEAPRLWKLKELRKQYRVASAEERRSIAHAGRTIREMERVWPANAANHVRRVLVAVRRVG